jgi:hypothetical protein
MKNMKNRIIVIFTLFAGLFLLNSCLKDDADYWPDDVAGKMYITVFNPTLQALSLQPVPDVVPFEFMINIATDQPPTTDVTVTLDIDPSAVTAYNARTGKEYLPYPSVKLNTPTITILAGTRTAMVQGEVWGADALNACDNFIAGITIKSVSDPKIMIPSNMKSYLLSLPISNPYAGDYNTVGYRIRPGNPTEMIAPGTVQAFNTVDCKTVKKNGFGNYTAFDIVIEVTEEVMVVGGVDCYKVIATPVDANGVSVGGMFTTWTGDATVTNPAPPANPTDINYYDPVAKVFVLNCYYTSSAGNRIMYEIQTRD